MNIDALSPPRSSPHGVWTDGGLNEQISMMLSSLFEERAHLEEDSSSDKSPHDPHDPHNLRDNAGVPVSRNYHPHLNGKSFTHTTSSDS